MLLFFARHFSFILYPFHLFHAFHSLPALSTLHSPHSAKKRGLCQQCRSFLWLWITFDRLPLCEQGVLCLLCSPFNYELYTRREETTNERDLKGEHFVFVRFVFVFLLFYLFCLVDFCANKNVSLKRRRTRTVHLCGRAVGQLFTLRIMRYDGTTSNCRFRLAFQLLFHHHHYHHHHHHHIRQVIERILPSFEWTI